MTGPTHPAAIEVNGVAYLRDAKGGLVPLAAVKAADLLMDETVRDIVAEATAMSAAIGAFKAAAFGKVASFQALLAQQYGATIGGKKGNVQLLSIDGCMRVQVAVSDLTEFGPELQSAKALIDECLTDWASGSKAELQALVAQAFQVDKQGQINRSGLFMLLRVESDDDRWKRAMEAIRDSIRIIGSREYVRFYHRPTPDAAWRAIPVDIASA